MDKVELIPWDPANDEHIKRLYDQRVACEWHHEMISQWSEDQREGSWAMYWIEHGPLTDAVPEIYHVPRVATGKTFVPVGHVALAPVDPGLAEELSLPQSSVWLQKLYVSWAIQRSGVGRTALAAAERTASLPPLNATVVALDALRGELQRSEEFLRKDIQ